MPDITHIKGSDQSEPKATLDEVAAEMKHWRANKAEQGTKIPRQLCRKILYLTRRHPERAVRSLLVKHSMMLCTMNSMHCLKAMMGLSL